MVGQPVIKGGLIPECISKFSWTLQGNVKDTIKFSDVFLDKGYNV